jgi:hypothetical protein
MASPTTRAELSNWCLRKLGSPVIDINVDEDQVSDRIDEAFQWYYDYHYDAVEKVYEKFEINYSILKFADSMTTFMDGIVADTKIPMDAPAGFEDTTNLTGLTVVDIHPTNPNWIYIKWDKDTAIPRTGNWLNNAGALSPAISGFSSGSLDVQYVEIPDNIIGITRIYKPTTSSIGMWDIRYQMRLSDLTTFGSYTGGYQLLSYEMRMKNIALIEELLTGEIPIRYNRHLNKLFVDWDWPNDAIRGEFIIIEASKIIDPNTYSDIYNDRWLKEFATALIKEQWGINLSKFDGVQLPGGVTLNGRTILEDAKAEIDKLKEELSLRYELPVDFMMA